MSIEALKDRLPAYAKDTKLNLSNILNSTALTKQQLWARSWCRPSPRATKR